MQSRPVTLFTTFPRRAADKRRHRWPRIGRSVRPFFFSGCAGGAVLCGQLTQPGPQQDYDTDLTKLYRRWGYFEVWWPVNLPQLLLSMLAICLRRQAVMAIFNLPYCRLRRRSCSPAFNSHLEGNTTYRHHRQMEDYDLIALIAQRDEAALDVLYDRCHRLISSVATAVVQRREEAEEITLDVLVRVREKAGTYRSEKARVSTWLARMTRNRAIDVLRREEVRPLKQSISWDSGPALQARARESTEAAAVMTLDKQRMREAMTSLS